jgi:thymidylate kinase
MMDERAWDRIVILDGHDGAGKSSVCALLANRLGGHVIKPFNNSLGDLIGWLWGSKRFAQAEETALAAIERELELAPPEGLLFFDRHWLSMFTVLPEEYFGRWEPRPFTVLCWTDLPTTLARLKARGEAEGDIAEHQHYLARYAELARRFGVPIVDTTSASTTATADRIQAMLNAGGGGQRALRPFDGKARSGSRYDDRT